MQGSRRGCVIDNSCVIVGRGAGPDAVMAPEAWVMEKQSLLSLAKAAPPVYIANSRTVDAEGYVHLNTIRYSVPDTLIGENVEVL